MSVDRDRMERSGNDNSVDFIQILDLKKRPVLTKSAI